MGQLLSGSASRPGVADRFIEWRSAARAALRSEMKGREAAARAARLRAHVRSSPLLPLRRAATWSGRCDLVRRCEWVEDGGSQRWATQPMVRGHGRCSWVTSTQCGHVLGHRRSGVVGARSAGSSGTPSARPPAGTHVDVLPRRESFCRTFVRTRCMWPRPLSTRTTRRVSAKDVMSRGDRATRTGRTVQPSSLGQEADKFGHMTETWGAYARLTRCIRVVPVPDGTSA